MDLPYPYGPAYGACAPQRRHPARALLAPTLEGARLIRRLPPFVTAALCAVVLTTLAAALFVGSAMLSIFTLIAIDKTYYCVPSRPLEPRTSSAP